MASYNWCCNVSYVNKIPQFYPLKINLTNAFSQIKNNENDFKKQAMCMQKDLFAVAHNSVILRLDHAVEPYWTGLVLGFLNM